MITLLVRGFHPLWSDFPDRFQFCYFSDVAVLLPRRRRNVNGLDSSAFARHYLRNHNCFLFLLVLRCFSSQRSPRISRYLVFNQVGFPIRKFPDHRSFAPSRNLSQLTTSFIASQSQGIHRSLLLSFSFREYRSYNHIAVITP